MVVLIAEAPLSRGAFYVHDFFEKVSWFVFELLTGQGNSAEVGEGGAGLVVSFSRRVSFRSCPWRFSIWLRLGPSSAERVTFSCCGVRTGDIADRCAGTWLILFGEPTLQGNDRDLGRERRYEPQRRVHRFGPGSDSNRRDLCWRFNISPKRPTSV